MALSFDRKIHFHTYWKPLFSAIFIVATAFIFWDEFFSQKEIWGFNPDYLQGIYLGHLPLEEVLFFFIVPYACLFLYEVLKGYFPNFKTKKIGRSFAFGICLSGLTFGSIYIENWYTASACILAAMLTIGIHFIRKEAWYGNFVFAFLVSQVPFILVNGTLTGMFTPEPIVWYSDLHIMGPRIGTIPVEDIYYNYDMLLLIAFFYERFKGRWS
jgi:lycopene cyclase domain-containing protein